MLGGNFESLNPVKEGLVNIKRKMKKTKHKFVFRTTFTPTGDQPTAIKELVAGLERGDKHQVLLGATGTGKTFTIANVIEKVQNQR